MESWAVLLSGPLLLAEGVVALSAREGLELGPARGCGVATGEPRDLEARK